MREATVADHNDNLQLQHEFDSCATGCSQFGLQDLIKGKDNVISIKVKANVNGVDKVWGAYVLRSKPVDQVNIAVCRSAE
jgi:hypothetical protein